MKYSSARTIASKEQLEAISFSSGKRHQFASCSVTNGMWYSRFQEGVHCRMGDTLKQDLALSIGVMLKLQEILEEDYQTSSGAGWWIVVEAAAFAETAYCISLRGFEVSRLI